MAFSHVYFNDQLQYGRHLRSALTKLKEGHLELTDVIGVMTTMIDGDGSDPAQFTEVTARFGFVSNAAAKAAWDELNSCASKFNTDASVTFVKTALAQALNKLA